MPMVRMPTWGRTLARVVLIALVTVGPGLHAARAQIAVSANDNKVALVDGNNSVPANPPPDTVTILDLGVTPPKVLGEVQAPASVVGPPQSVAVAPDESLALVTGAMKVDPADPRKLAPDDKLSVIDLNASPPAVTQTLQAGPGASGVSINPAGTLALVANRSEGTLSVFTISGKTLSPAGKLDFGKASQPSHVVFTPDGRTALLTRDGDHRVSLLSVDGSKVEDTKRFMIGGYRPYSIVVGPKGDVAVFTNQGGGQGDADQINVVDLTVRPPRVVDAITVGQTPEGVSMAPDGAHIAVTVHNGSPRPKSHPAYNDHALLRVFKVDGTRLTLVASAKCGVWAQGSVWSRDGKTILVQATDARELQVFAFDGKDVTLTGTIKVSGHPVGIRPAVP
jgi:DNA-binding beta-propeller fold protein YncE